MKMFKHLVDEAREDNSLKETILEEGLINCDMGKNIIAECQQYHKNLLLKQHIPCLYLPYKHMTNKVILYLNNEG